jgi:hypothetical protein
VCAAGLLTCRHRQTVHDRRGIERLEHHHQRRPEHVADQRRVLGCRLFGGFAKGRLWERFRVCMMLRQTRETGPRMGPMLLKPLRQPILIGYVCPSVSSSVKPTHRAAWTHTP